MFEPAEIGAKMSDRAFKPRKDQLRLDLIDLQRRVREAGDFPVIILGTGVPGAGLVDTVNLLNTWMDPRWIATTVFDTPTDEERERPPFWRYWQAMPAAGTTGLFLGGWYEDPIRDMAVGSMTKSAYRERLQRIAAFEKTLADDGALILKFWLHVSKREQRKQDTSRHHDALVGLRPTDTSLALPGSYDSLISAGATAIRATNTVGAPWHIVEGGDDNYRRATVLEILRDALEAHIKARHKKAKAAKRLAKARAKKAKKERDTEHAPRLLDALDMKHSLSAKAYLKRFHAVQRKLYETHKAARAAKLSTVLVFEGWDAAGKGGAIRRLSYALNARNYKIVPIAAPTDEERAHHYLWRFWRNLQRAGRMTIFDRSWYGRVLVERVEGFIDQDTWTRAYSEIRTFEDDLIQDSTVVLKFWLHITKKEQLRRFKSRAHTGYKRWKLTPDDWRNRENWDAYEDAVTDMVTQTSTDNAPWHLVPANDKHFARIAILETIESTLARAVNARKTKASRREKPRR